MTNPQGGGGKGGTSAGGGVSSFNTRTGAVSLTKADVTGTGLAAGDVGAIPTTAEGVASGVATLDGTGNVPLAQLGNVPGGAGVSSFNTRTGAVSLTKADVTGTGLAAADVGALAKASNLSDLASATTARTNLGLGTAATQATSAFDAAGAATAAQAAAIAASAQRASNLSDLASATTARTNLGLGTAAVANTGTASGNVPVLGASGTVAPAQLGTSPAAGKYLDGTGAFSVPAASLAAPTIDALPASLTSLTSSTAAATTWTTSAKAAGTYMVTLTCGIVTTSSLPSYGFWPVASSGTITGAPLLTNYPSQTNQLTTLTTVFYWTITTSSTLTLWYRNPSASSYLQLIATELLTGSGLVATAFTFLKIG